MQVQKFPKVNGPINKECAKMKQEKTINVCLRIIKFPLNFWIKF